MGVLAAILPDAGRIASDGPGSMFDRSKGGVNMRDRIDAAGVVGLGPERGPVVEVRAAIMVAVFGVNLSGGGLRDLVDPRSRRLGKVY